MGTHTVNARINWADHYFETNTANNEKNAVLTVCDYDYAQEIRSVNVADDYVAGESVISSFYVYNDGTEDIIPSQNNTVKFRAYYLSGSNQVTISEQTKTGFAIPSGKRNLVYFKWSVPADMGGKTIYCECSVNENGNLHEEDASNNKVTLSKVIAENVESQTPHTRYANSEPASYLGANVPSVYSESATWNEYVYENGAFVLKNYGIAVNNASPEITPDSHCTTAVNEGGAWKIKSGYGINLSYAPGLKAISGYAMPTNEAYTEVQKATATFREYNYSEALSACRTLEKNTKYQFKANSDAAENGRTHFIPLWMKDGQYVVSVIADEVWTPVGVIRAVRNSNAITIDGTLYDDWYNG